jgi:thiamine kinase-like enzyme
MVRFAKVSDLTDPDHLVGLTGPIAAMNNTLLSAVGYSGSVLERIEVKLQSGTIRNFILKDTRFESDWLSQRANDQVGREAALLNESSLSGIWNCIHCPYCAFASENGRIGLLMDDYTDYLFPDIREPIDIRSEDLIIKALAAVHALFWESSEVKKIKWMVKPPHYLQAFGPTEHESDRFAPPPEKIRNSMREGWGKAMQLLPARIGQILSKPANELFEPWKDLPITLLHGDAKMANMAILPPGKLVLFDWTYVGCGPCGIELGWFLAVNSTRLARTKEDFIAKYRSCLESGLKFGIDEKTWSKMTELAILSGAMMMLWSKALGYHGGTERGKEEWAWWETHIKKVVSNRITTSDSL